MAGSYACTAQYLADLVSLLSSGATRSERPHATAASKNSVTTAHRGGHGFSLKNVAPKRGAFSGFPSKSTTGFALEAGFPRNDTPTWLCPSNFVSPRPHKENKKEGGGGKVNQPKGFPNHTRTPARERAEGARRVTRRLSGGSAAPHRISGPDLAMQTHHLGLRANEKNTIVGVSLV